MKICFIIDQISQPRCLKRIDSIYFENIPLCVHGFDNGLYNENTRNKPYNIQSCRINHIGFSLSNFFRKCRYIRNVIKKLDNDDIIYLFGFNIALIAFFFKGNHKYFYEEADLGYLRSKPIIRRILKSIDTFLMKHSEVTILTSQGFIEYLNKDASKSLSGKVILLPNKLNDYFVDKTRTTSFITNNSIKFSFIGLIRYPNTVLRFARVIGESFSDHEFHFYGDGPSAGEAKQLADKYSNIFYHGSFRSPFDLGEIYNKTDVNIACYDTTSHNVKLAEPNKLYESIFFGKPIVVSKETFLAERVEMMDAGWSISADMDEKIINFVSNLSIKEINRKIFSCSIIPTNELVNNQDSLNKIIRQLYETNHSII